MSIEKTQQTASQSILIIDDNAELLDLTKMILEANSYHVVTALSGKEALSILAKIDKPDLILLDLRMEDMSGPEFIVVLERELPKVFGSVPIVFISGEENIPRSKASGFIRKPFDMSEFLAAVRRYIEIGTSQIRLN